MASSPSSPDSSKGEKRKSKRLSCVSATKSERRSVAVEPIKVGERVCFGGKSWALGTVRFHGTTKFAEGMWYGVELDRKNGKNNGSVDNVSYFECPEAHGLFCKEDKIQRAERTMQAEIAALKEENESLKEQVGDSLAKLTEMQVESNISQDQLKTNREVEALKEEKQSLQNRVEDVMTKLTGLQSEKHALEEQLTSNTEAKALQVEKQSLQDQVQDVTAKLTEVQAEKHTLQEQLTGQIEAEA
eukprot:CAMPEP_0115602900 /NCGR_PEP_ID=MMETSP0272-20121206/16147_1 /TAXON_ID=71861 /ORGANISM="Scrippsiella trochoidea, Strain CCMP3099" /LENGTH=243 /DNA_ID=CAMNT_0003038399 /DNA_START=11 /DNA_END=738 /DNA_ORIENTATION=+